MFGSYGLAASMYSPQAQGVDWMPWGAIGSAFIGGLFSARGRS